MSASTCSTWWVGPSDSKLMLSSSSSSMMIGSGVLVLVSSSVISGGCSGVPSVDWFSTDGSESRLPVVFPRDTSLDEYTQALSVRTI